MKRRILLLCIGIFIGKIGLSQNVNDENPEVQKYEKMWKQLEEESKTYYIGADRANYGVRYLWTYMFDKSHKSIYKENRILLIAKESTLDMSYQSIGERKWLKEHYRDRKVGRDSTLAYHLTPSFYFYNPKRHHLKQTYRVISEEFLLQDTTYINKWNITNEEKTIGGYLCKKALCQSYGRKWNVWFTTDLPYMGGPRMLVGLPGVILEASDENGEIKWEYEGIVKFDDKNRLFIKYPDHFSTISIDKFPVILKLFSLTDISFIQRSGVINDHPKMLPEICVPSTGIDACYITNPIDLNKSSY